jgi:hypothetical protein
MDLDLLFIMLRILTLTHNISSITTSYNCTYWHVSLFNEYNDNLINQIKIVEHVCSMLNVLLNYQY